MTFCSRTVCLVTAILVAERLFCIASFGCGFAALGKRVRITWGCHPVLVLRMPMNNLGVVVEDDPAAATPTRATASRRPAAADCEPKQRRRSPGSRKDPHSHPAGTD